MRDRAVHTFYPLPNAIIIGTMKGGTTSLFNYLRRHPDIAVSRVKEVRYFDQFYNRGELWYRRRFAPGLRAAPRVLEATPGYLVDPNAPERIAQDLPEVRLIAVLRDPAERAYSHWRHMVRTRRESRSFEEAIADEMALVDRGHVSRYAYEFDRRYSYLRRGLYQQQLDRYRRAGLHDQLRVFESAQLFADPQTVLDQCCIHLGVPPRSLGPFRPYNQHEEPPEAIPMRDELERWFKLHDTAETQGAEPGGPY